MEGWEEPGVERLSYRSTITGCDVSDLDYERANQKKGKQESGSRNNTPI